MVTRYNSITTNKTFIELGKIKVYTDDVKTDEQEHEINAKFDSRKLLNQFFYEKCVFTLHSPTIL